jgi:predicted RNA-binding protein with RPS1 domain
VSAIPSEVVQVGQELDAKVLKFDAEKNRVSLGIKQLGDDPWHGVSRRYPQGTRLFGKVTNIADYGAFVEIEPGIEGLVHVSEMDWTNKNVAPSKMVSLGEEVEVMVLEIDEDKRRISLGMKQCKANPWEEFSATVQRGDRVKGPVKSITDFGVFVGLAAGIDGLVHLSDLSWNEPGESAVRNYKKGQEVEAIVLAVDVDRERISLGIKQLDSDPFTSYSSVNDRGALVTGKVKTVDARGAEIQLNDDITGLPAGFRDQPRPRRGRAQRAEGRRRGQRHDHQRRPQGALDPALDQGQGQRRPAGSDAASVAVERARDRRHDQPGRAAAGQARQQARVRQRGEGCMTRRISWCSWPSASASSPIATPSSRSRPSSTRWPPRWRAAIASRSAASAASRSTGGRRASAAIPRSGEQVVISEKLVPHFKPGKALREAVDARVGAKRGEPAESAAEPPPRVAAGD